MISTYLLLFSIHSATLSSYYLFIALFNPKYVYVLLYINKLRYKIKFTALQNQYFYFFSHKIWTKNKHHISRIFWMNPHEFKYFIKYFLWQCYKNIFILLITWKSLPCVLRALRLLREELSKYHESDIPKNQYKLRGDFYYLACNNHFNNYSCSD